MNVLGTLSSMLSTAKHWGYSTEVVTLNKLTLPEDRVRQRPQFFTPAEIRSIIAAAEEPWRTLFMVPAMVGLRAGEALGLQACDLDFDRRTITIRRAAWCGRIQTTKSRRSEAVLPMPEPL